MLQEQTKVTKRVEIALSRASTNKRDGWRSVSCYHYPIFVTKIPTRTHDFHSFFDSDAKHWQNADRGHFKIQTSDTGNPAGRGSCFGISHSPRTPLGHYHRGSICKHYVDKLQRFSPKCHNIFILTMPTALGWRYGAVYGEKSPKTRLVRIYCYGNTLYIVNLITW